MSDTPTDTATPPSDQGNSGDNGANPPAPSQDGTTPQPVNTPPESIPYDRFKAVNDSNKALEEKVAAMEAAEKQRKEELAKEQGKYEELYNDSKPKLDEYDTMKTTFDNMLQTTIDSIPEDKRGLIPADYPAHKQLEWINANRSILTSTQSGNTPVNPPSGDGKAGDKPTFTAAQINDPAFFRENMAEIKVALNEGRIVD